MLHPVPFPRLRFKLPAILLCVLCLAVPMFAPAAKADAVNNVFRYVCAPELGLIDVEAGNLNGGDVYTALAGKDMRTQFDRYGFALVNFLIERDKDAFVVDLHELAKECRIGGKTYQLRIKGAVGNVDGNGRCGECASIRLTVLEDGRPLVSDVQFDPMRPLDEPTDPIQRIRLRPNEGYLLVDRDLHFFDLLLAHPLDEDMVDAMRQKRRLPKPAD